LNFLLEILVRRPSAPRLPPSLEKWRDKLPEQLLTYWQQEGWCEYKDGLFCTVDLDDYEDLVDEWLADTVG
jgi:hypothetical protein